MEIVCVECGSTIEDKSGERGQARRCECGGVLDPIYETDYTFSSLESVSMWEYEGVLPLSRSQAVSMSEGNTPLVECESIAERLGVSDFYVKDEGRNPTGSVRDREMSAAVSVVQSDGVYERVSLASTGNSGVSAAAYAARAGLECEVFVPSRTQFDAKAIINVHGGDMTVVRGRFNDAEKRFRDELSRDEEVYSLSAFDTPFRHDAVKTAGYEIHDEIDVDHVVCPVGTGTVYVGLDKGLNSGVNLHAVQPEGCAPIAKATETGSYEKWDQPDTVVGELEVPDPPAPSYVVEAIQARGEATTVSDGAALDVALDVASVDGVELSPAGGACVAGALELRDAFGKDDTVVALNTSAGRPTSDVLRNRLMSHGV